MKSFAFKLIALLRLRETKKNQALAQFASSVKKVKNLVDELGKTRANYESVLKLVLQKQQNDFSGVQIQALQNSLNLEREKLEQIELQLKQAKSIQESRRNIFVNKDSEHKAILRLSEKQKDEHYQKEYQKEQKELEDITGSRFLFQRINRQA